MLTLIVVTCCGQTKKEMVATNMSSFFGANTRMTDPFMAKDGKMVKRLQTTQTLLVWMLAKLAVHAVVGPHQNLRERATIIKSVARLT